MRNRKKSQSGNVFFTLFGAVGLVGVLGASTMTIMKGPVKSMAEVTKRTVAENNMIAAGRLAIVAVKQQTNEDCDADDFVEPLPWDTGSAAPAGGGNLPASVGASRLDPWGTTYGYCGWDHGTAIDNAGCGGASQRRLRGENASTKTVIAIISAGPNRVFETGCNDSSHATAPYVARVVGSDDMVLEYTYAESEGMAGGLWNVKSGDLKTAEIDKNLEVKNEANAVVMAFDQTTDANKPTLKVDFIQLLTTAKKGVEFLSNVKLGTSWISGDGDNEGISVNNTGVVTASGQVNVGRLNATENIASGNGHQIQLNRSSAASQLLLGFVQNGTQMFNMGIPAGQNYFLFGQYGAGTNWIFSGGKVGIGTSTPHANALLDVAGAVTSGREGFSGVYNSAQVQGVWSMGPQYKIDTAANTFGNQYGIVYGYNTSSTGAANTPMSNWGHQLLNVSNGSVTSGVSLSYGHGYFMGNVGIGDDSPSHALDITKPSPVIALQDSDNTNAQVGVAGYLSLRDSANTEYGWIGDGSTTDNVIRVTGSAGRPVALNAGGDRLTVNTNGSVEIPGFINDTGSATAGLKFISGGYLSMNSPSASYDVWLQGNSSSTAGGTARNLALLGHAANDTLYVNHASEYGGGTIIGGPVRINGDINVTGTYTGQGDNLGNHTATQNLDMANRAIVSDAGTIRDANGGWVRTYNNTGWYNGTWAGGWTMQDASYLRNQSGEGVYVTTTTLPGVTGDSDTSYGVRGISGSVYGVYGKTNDATKGGVIGYTQNNSIYGILGHANAYSLYGNGQVYTTGKIATGSGFEGGSMALTGNMTGASITLTGNINAEGYVRGGYGSTYGMIGYSGYSLYGNGPIYATGNLNIGGNATIGGSLNMGGDRITGVGAPSAGTDAATKAYVDSKTTGGAPTYCWLDGFPDGYTGGTSLGHGIIYNPVTTYKRGGWLANSVSYTTQCTPPPCVCGTFPNFYKTTYTCTTSGQSAPFQGPGLVTSTTTSGCSQRLYCGSCGDGGGSNSP